jgi:ABC-type multidrug transport system ATPase subunit/ABC-type multidrug transport system permease subunit
LAWAIETCSLTKYFPESQGWRSLWERQAGRIPAVRGVDLRVKEGELFGLLGPNGAGKTTLIKMLSTLITPTSGTARVGGFGLEEGADIKRVIGLVTSDERSFYWRLSGRQNLVFFANLQHIPVDEIPARVAQVLEQAGLQVPADKRFQTYSSGMRQRLSIARALLNRPRLLFLDEPTKGLDPTATQNLHALVRTLSGQEGITILLTTHYLGEAEALCERIAIMNQGQIRACGTLAELREGAGLQEHTSIQVRNLTPETQAQLERQFPGLEVQRAFKEGLLPVGSSIEESDPPDVQAGVTIRLDTKRHGRQAGDQAIDILRQGKASILAFNNQDVSLQRIFSEVISDAPPPTKTISGEEDGGKIPEGSLRSTRQAKRSNIKGRILRLAWPEHPLAILLAFLKRDVNTEISYRFSFFFQFFRIFFSVGVFYFIAQLLGEAAAPYLAPYGGDYFSFVLIGIAFAGYFGVGLTSFSNSLRQAQTTGTLEAMLTTPTGLSTIVLSSSVWDYLMTTFRVLVYLGVGALFLGVNLGGGNYLAALVVLVLTVVAFSSLGILAASFIMVLKRGDPITWAFSAVASFLGGVYYPVAVLPGWLQVLAKFLPITYALQAMRLALLQGSGLRALLPDILALSAFCVVLLPASLYAFRYAVDRARMDGSLTHY